ncbi:hypothetical protein [Dyadobacter sp. 3J3]|uniref:hypothetical protein n=1 Tax=Dyadobacter sp. 3J3 TaxID=2606600 RepID=UPI00135A567A|nr:hypothetical protein [Dyadobacter sp. 3J3]
MKNLFSIIISIFSLSIISCNKENDTAAPEQLLNIITEKRYLPEDSLTIQYQVDRDGIIVLEKSSKYGARKGYKDSEQLNKIEASLKYCRIFTYNLSNQLIKIVEIDNESRKLPSSSDTLIYQNGRVVARVLKDYLLKASLGTFVFAYPLWQTNRTFGYDASNRIITETDSVFIGHDIPLKSSTLEKTDLRFIYRVLTKNNYNENGELTEKIITTSRMNAVLYGNGSGAWDITKAGKVISGSTTYNYQYDSKNQLISKLAKFTDSKTNQVYNSIFSYSYGSK